MRASGVVNCQLALVCLVLRSFSQAAIFRDQGLPIGNASIEALGGQDAEFGFGEIEPAAVLGGVVPFESLDQAARFGGGKGLVK